MTTATPNAVPTYLKNARVRCTEKLTGTFYEACDCEVLCPCWVGQAPDQNVCNGLFAWDVAGGKLDLSGIELDLAGLRVASASHHEGLRGTSGSQRVAVFVDDGDLTPKLTDDQLAALVAVFLGLGGGSLQGLGALLGTPVNTPPSLADLRDAVVRRISFGSSSERTVLVEKAGRIAEIDAVFAQALPAQGSGFVTVNPSALSESLGPGTVATTTRLAIFTPELVPGSYLDLDLHGRSATFGQFCYEKWN